VRLTFRQEDKNKINKIKIFIIGAERSGIIIINYFLISGHFQKKKEKHMTLTIDLIWTFFIEEM
jgi:hypothetical protein